MRTRSKLATITLSTGLALAGFAFPAQADVTTATFTITAGALSISVPASPVALATVSTGALTASGQLGAVTVTDNRGLLVNIWTTTVTSSAFVTGGSSAPYEVVTEPNVAYASGSATTHTGLGAFVPGTKAVPPTHTGLAGNSLTTWNPTVTFTLGSSQVAGIYSGTVTHALA